jgi:hypothetical protein
VRSVRRLALILCVAAAAGAWVSLSTAAPPDVQLVPYPDGKTYAISIEDDADGGSLERLAPVYRFLDAIGVRVTKLVWVFPAAAPSGDVGMTLSSPEYRAFVLALKAHGHEIGLHGVSAGNDPREQIVRGVARFTEILGGPPRLNADHSKNIENLYFGKHRLNGAWFRTAYGVFDGTDYQGEREGGLYFWGDIARDTIRHHRGWYVTALNTLAMNRSMPAPEPDKPYVRYWHAVTDARDAEAFTAQLSPDRVERLKADRGAAILYTHFAFGFYDPARRTLDERFERIMRSLAADHALWVTTASDLLDRLILFKRVRIERVDGGVAVENTNDTAVRNVTLVLNGGARGAPWTCSGGCAVRNPRAGVVVIDELPARSVTRLAGPPVASAGGPVMADVAGQREIMRCATAWLWRSVQIRL